MTTIIASIVLIGVIVFIHELGHFTAAKLSNVKVEVFSLGFGPKLVGFRWGETEYVISAIPFGGFVKMEGESPEEDGEGGQVELSERSFLAKPKRTRAFIVAAGPAMNFLLAIVIYIVLTYQTGMAVFITRQIGVVEDGSPASEAGLRPGDVVLEVGGGTVQNWDGIAKEIEGGLGSEVGLLVDRAGLNQTLTMDLRDVEEYDDVGIDLYMPPVADSVVAGSPAEAAGMRPGDRIVMIEDRTVSTWQDIARSVEPAPGESLTISWMRGDELLASTIRPDDVGGIGKIGIVNDYVGEYELRPVGLLRSFERGIRNAAWMSIQIVNLPRLWLAGYPVRELLGGPVRISQLAGETLRLGLGTFFAFIAAVSAQLSLINLLPIPVLDGGHLLVLGVEALARKPISMRQRIIAQQIGLALLIAFMVYVTLVDVSRLLGG